MGTVREFFDYGGHPRGQAELGLIKTICQFIVDKGKVTEGRAPIGEKTCVNHFACGQDGMTGIEVLVE